MIKLTVKATIMPPPLRIPISKAKINFKVSQLRHSKFSLTPN